MDSSNRTPMLLLLVMWGLCKLVLLLDADVK